MPVVLITRLLNVATPLDAVAVAVVEPVENLPLLRVKVTVELFVVTTFPKASSTSTVTPGLMATPAVALVGCWPKTNLVAAAALIVKVDEVAVVRAASVAMSV